MKFPDLSDGSWKTREIVLGTTVLEAFVKRFDQYSEAYDFVAEWHAEVYAARGAVFIGPTPVGPSATAEQLMRWAEEGGEPPWEERERWFEVFFVAPVDFELTLCFLDHFGFLSSTDYPRGLCNAVKKLLRSVHEICPSGLAEIHRDAVWALFLDIISDEQFEPVFRKVYDFNRAHFSTELTPEHTFSNWRSMNGVTIGPM